MRRSHRSSAFGGIVRPLNQLLRLVLANPLSGFLRLATPPLETVHRQNTRLFGLIKSPQKERCGRPIKVLHQSRPLKNVRHRSTRCSKKAGKFSLQRQAMQLISGPRSVHHNNSDKYFTGVVRQQWKMPFWANYEPFQCFSLHTSLSVRILQARNHTLSVSFAHKQSIVSDSSVRSHSIPQKHPSRLV